MLGKSIFMTNSAHKSFHKSVNWMSLTQQSTDVFTLFPTGYYESSDIEFYTVIKI